MDGLYLNQTFQTTHTTSFYFLRPFQKFIILELEDFTERARNFLSKLPTDITPCHVLPSQASVHQKTHIKPQMDVEGLRSKAHVPSFFCQVSHHAAELVIGSFFLRRLSCEDFCVTSLDLFLTEVKCKLGLRKSIFSYSFPGSIRSLFYLFLPFLCLDQLKVTKECASF